MSEYLDEEEQIARIRSWWDENGTFVIVAVVLGVVGIVGWSWYGSVNEQSRHEATRAYIEYVEAAEAEKDVAFESLALDFKGAAVHTLALFDRARQAIAEGDFQAAQEHLEKVVELGDDPLLVDLARIRLAKVQQELGMSDAALTSLGAVRNEGFRPWTLETQGDIYLSQGNVEAAHQAYQTAVDNLLPGDERPFLRMKLENTEPFDGEFVEMTDTLSQILREAHQQLSDVPEVVEEETQEEITGDAETVEDPQAAEDTGEDGGEG